MFSFAAKLVRARSLLASSVVASSAVALSLAGFAGCAPASDFDEGPEQVLLSLTSLPADVACLRVTAEGKTRTVVKHLAIDRPAAPADPTAESGDSAPLSKPLGGLPLGTVVFTADAFEKPCDDVTAASVPAWVSEPDTASIALGRLTTVTLSLKRNGRAKVNVTFTDEPACTAVAEACGSAKECCSGTCTSGVCQTAPAGG